MVYYLIKKVDFLCVLAVLILNATQISYSRDISEEYLVASTLTIADGLQCQDINDIYFDEKGFAWIGTFGGGISKYDGESFITFSSRTNPAIKNDYINNCVQDRFNRLWIVGNLGVDVIDLTTMRPCVFIDKLPSFFSSPLINSIGISSDGSIWYNSNTIIVRISFSEDGSINQHKVLYFEDSAVGISHLLFDVENDGSMWFAKNGTLHKIIPDSQDKLCVIDILPHINFGEFNLVTSTLKEDQLLWIGTQKGLCRINLLSGDCYKYWEHPHSGDGVWNNEITSLCVSQDGNILVGTLSGVFIYDNQKRLFSELSSKPNKYGNRMLMGNLVRVVACQNSNIWIGQEVKGLTVLRKKNLPITDYSNDNSVPEMLPDSPVRAILYDSHGQMWLSSTKNGVYLKSPPPDNNFSIEKLASESFENITSFCEDGDGKIWFGTASGEIGYWGITDHKPVVPSSSKHSEICRDISDIYQMIYDRINNSIWILSRTGLFVYNISEDSFSTYSDSIYFCLSGFIDEFSKLWVSHSGGLTLIDLGTLTSESISGIPMGFSMFHLENDVWLGTIEQGVWIISKDLSNGVVVKKRYTSRDGLCDDRIRGMARTKGVLWITSENGLSKLDMNSQEICKYGIHDGLGSMAFCENSIAVDNSGTVYLGRKEGLSWIEPSYIKRNTGLESNILISSCLINGEQVNTVYSNNVEIHERDKDITIIFSDLSYNDYDIQYQSRIDYINDSWSQIYGNRKFVRLGKVPPGNHKIEIRAINSDGNELSKAALILKVKPYFYKKWWFILLLFALTIVIIRFIIHWRTYAINKKKEQLQEEVDKKTKILMEQKSLIQKERDKLSEQNQILLQQNELLAGNKLLTFNDQPTENSKFIKKAMATIRRMYKDSELDVDTFSEEMGMSRSVLNNKIHDTIGLSIVQFIRDYRLNVAKEMISNGINQDKNISEIAYDVGFNDPKYFTRCFSKKFGIAPADLYKELPSEK